MEESDAHQSEALSTALASSGANSQPAAPEPVWCSGPNGRKWPPEGAESDTKQQESEPKQVQAGSYATEMFAAHAAPQRVIGLVVHDDLLYVWCYDRQPEGSIQCFTLNVIRDFPRFLVLLAMQRFEDRHRGLHSNVDPKFGTTTTLLDEIDITLQSSSNDHITHVGLNGQATNVFPAPSKAVPIDDGLVAKVFWAEETRRGEPYKIAQGDHDVTGHVPDMVCSTTHPFTSISAIRKCLGLETNGSRVLYLIVFKKLKLITGLSGDEFLDAWFETAKCHLVLWKKGVYHRDVSPSNLMCRMVNGKMMGVLNDFDLASIDPGVKGTDRTGTVPFMALPLLSSAGLNGDIEHLYEHDAESFIWVLTWVALRYDKGKLREKNRPLDEWLKVDAGTCRKEKREFLFGPDRHDSKPGVGHERNWRVATECLNELGSKQFSDNKAKKPLPALDEDAAFQRLLQGPLELCPPNPEN